MRVAGIDYSMTSPAICVWDTDTPFEPANLFWYSYSSGPKKCTGPWDLPKGGYLVVEAQRVWGSDQERYDQASDWAMVILRNHQVEKVNLEGYSMGSSSGLVFNIGENTGLLKHKLWKAGIKIETPSPGSVKKSFTGKGNANKEAMGDRFFELFDFWFSDLWAMKHYSSPENDLVDAAALARMFAP